MNLRRASVAAVALSTVLAVSACGSDESDDTASDTPTSAAPTDEASETPEAAAAEGQPAWARGLTTPGTKIATVDAGDLTVDVYQVGVTQATKTGNFVDPEKNEPIIAEGDDIVFVNYVITNNGDPIDLGYSLVDVSARYENWPYLQGMDGITDSALFEAQDVLTSGPAPGGDSDVFTLGTGESFSYGENFRYEKGVKLDVKVGATPVDASGDLIHDEKIEGEGSGTIS